MVGRSTLMVFIAATIVAVGERAGSEPQGPPFRAGVDLVSLNVSVTSPEHRYVGSLDRADFVVTENGIAQDVTFFARTGVPLALAFLIDTSSSMQATLDIAREAATGFVRQMGSADLATVVSFDSSVEILQGFTTDTAALTNAIQRTRANGSTALYNAMYIALKELNKTVPRDDKDTPRRRAIVVLSDGDDTASLVSFDEVLDVASRSDTIIYTIGLGRRDNVTPKYQDGDYVLRKLAQQTGGRSFFPQQPRELITIYQEIRDELSNQYSLAYESSVRRRDGKWRQINVQITRPGLTARTRQGYFAPAK